MADADATTIAAGTPGLRLMESAGSAVAAVVSRRLPVGANVYLMSRQFDTLSGPVASSLVISTALSAVTTPLILVLIGASPR